MAENKEAIILQAATEEFLEKGLDGARTVSIAKRAGVTHAMLHYYFRTKEQLFNRIIEDKMHALAESIMEIFKDYDAPLKERLERGIATHFDFLKENPELPRFIVRDLNHINDVLIKTMLPKVLPIWSEAMKMQKELGTDIEVYQLALHIVSQNVFPFLMLPVAEKMGMTEVDRDRLLEGIKQENIKSIMKRLGFE